MTTTNPTSATNGCPAPRGSASRASGHGLLGLIALNVALLALLAWVTFPSSAGAQSRRNGLYSIVGGTVNGAPTGVAYIVDEVNQEMVAVSWNDTTKKLVGLGYANLAADAAKFNRSRP